MLCICVDDFGLHVGINEAAIRLAALGRVHAIGCLVGGAAWTDASSRRLRRLRADSIDVGLHLDFTEAPLLPGSRRALPALIAASLLRRLDGPTVRTEIRAQLEAFERGLGRAPAFVDGHQHVHQLPIVRKELLDELASRYRGRRPWLRSTQVTPVALPRGTDHWRAFIKTRGIEMLGSRALSSMARRMGFAQNRALLGIYDFDGDAERYRALLAAWLHAAGDADLLMCHPGAGFDKADAIGPARRAEYQVLRSAGFDEMLRLADVTLAPMSRTLRRRPGAD